MIFGGATSNFEAFLFLRMANDPAFLFYPGDYLRDTQCLSEKAQVAYDRIMCEHMRNICISQAQLNFFTKRLNDDEKSEILLILTKISGGFQITWVAESIVKRRLYSESRSKNRKNHMKTYDEHMENEIEIVNEDKITINIEFDFFWNLYDKKVGEKEKLKKKWIKLKDSERQSAIDHIPKYKQAQPDKKFRKNPETYLNNKSWNDEIIENGNQQIFTQSNTKSNRGTSGSRVDALRTWGDDLIQGSPES